MRYTWRVRAPILEGCRFRTLSKRFIEMVHDISSLVKAVDGRFCNKQHGPSKLFTFASECAVTQPFSGAWEWLACSIDAWRGLSSEQLCRLVHDVQLRQHWQLRRLFTLQVGKDFDGNVAEFSIRGTVSASIGMD